MDPPIGFLLLMVSMLCISMLYHQACASPPTRDSHPYLSWFCSSVQILLVAGPDSIGYSSHANPGTSKNHESRDAKNGEQHNFPFCIPIFKRFRFFIASGSGWSRYVPGLEREERGVSKQNLVREGQSAIKMQQTWFQRSTKFVKFSGLFESWQ